MKVRYIIIGIVIIIVVFITGLKLGKENATIQQAVIHEGRTEIQEGRNTANKGRESAKKVKRFLTGNRNVKSMLLDGDTLWAGTSGGVIKHKIASGKTTIYNNKSGLLSNGIFSLDKINGQIWVGTYGGGLSVLDTDGTWLNYNVPNGLADAFIYDAVKMKDGSIWIATWSGANRIVGNIDDLDSWEVYTVENTNGGLPNDWVYGLIRDETDDTLWLATEGGLAHFDGKVWKSWNHNDGQGAPYELVKPDIPFREDPAKASKHHARQKKEMGLEDVDISYNPNYIVSIEMDSHGKLWVGTWGGGVSIMTNERYIKTYTVRDGLPGNHIFMVKEGPDGNIWLGTSNGLSRFDGKEFKNYSQKDGLVSNSVFSIAFAEDGSMWVGSFGGISHFKEGLS